MVIGVSRIDDDNDLKLITTLNGQHSVALNDKVHLVTGGYCVDWSGAKDLFLFDSRSCRYHRFEGVLPYSPRPITVEEDESSEEDPPAKSEGLVQCGDYTFVVWNSWQCFLLTISAKKEMSLEDISLADAANLQMSFKKLSFVPLEAGKRECVRMASYARYKHFVICVGGALDDGREMHLLDQMYVLNLETLLWTAFTPPRFVTNCSSVVSTDAQSGVVVLNVIGGVEYEEYEDEDNIRCSRDISVDKHQILFLGYDDAVRRRVWNALCDNEGLPQNLWLLVFDMWDEGILGTCDKPYNSVTD